MDLAASEERHDAVTDLLQPQALFHHRAVIPGHCNRVRIAQKVGRMQHIHMQRVTFDPLAAVKQPSQQPNCRINLNSQRALDSMSCAHLVGDGANAADSRRDIDSL